MLEKAKSVNDKEAVQSRNEEAAEDRYYDILDEPEVLGLPDNLSELLERPINQERLNACATFVQKVAFLEELAHERMSRTFRFDILEPVEGVVIGEISPEIIKRTIDRIKLHQEVIGEGGDAVVVIDKNELPGFPPEVCYKFYKEPEVKRGRNSIDEEVEMHDEYYRHSLELRSQYGIGVPTPYYVTELGKDKMIAMEKLPAKSVDDILRHKGTIPEWFDVDDFCANLKALLEEYHRRGLYHRDIHPGNIMIRQTPELPADGIKGYIIDFGLSSYGQENMSPYEKWVAGERFTYNDDCAIIETIRTDLRLHQKL